MTPVQEKELDILKAIIKVIEDNGLSYFAIGGTCIGAVRHNGFIPWDDDIDIAMPRKDYELFRTKLYKELPANLKKLDYDNSERNDFLFVKIHDTTTTFVENYAKDSPDRYTGAFVDIMPMDGFPEEIKRQKYYVKLYHKLSYWNSKIRPLPMDYNKGSLKKYARKILHLIFPYNYFSKKIFDHAQKYDYENSKYICFTWRGQTSCDIKRKVFERKFFLNSREMKFENIMIRIPIEFDEYLTQDFGDYMKLPPEDKRNSRHDVYICDMERPCAYYAKLREEGKL